MTQTTFDVTRAALAKYDHTQAQRDAAWDAAQTDQDAAVANQADTAALRMVQCAYHLDTHWFNSREHCMRVDLEFMRRMAAKG